MCGKLDSFAKYVGLGEETNPDLYGPLLIFVTLTLSMYVAAYVEKKFGHQASLKTGQIKKEYFSAGFKYAESAPALVRSSHSDFYRFSTQSC